MQSGAIEYAGDILTQLQLTITKMQKDLIKLERNIENGRQRIQEKQEKLLTEEKINAK